MSGDGLPAALLVHKLMWILILVPALPIALFAAVVICASVKRPEKKRACILVLGAKVHPDGSMSRSLQYRCEAALSAWERGVSEKIIVCGGRVGDAPCSEASVMAAYLFERNVPPEAVILEDTSRNTVENFLNAGRIMQEHGFSDAAIVTSDYHLQRALWIARKFAIRAGGIPAQAPRSPRSWMKNMIRECVSWGVFWWYELKTGRRGTSG